MAPFLDLSRLSFEIWKAPYLLDVRLAPFFGPLAHAPSDLVLDQGNDCLPSLPYPLLSLYADDDDDYYTFVRRMVCYAVVVVRVRRRVDWSRAGSAGRGRRVASGHWPNICPSLSLLPRFVSRRNH